MIHGSVSNLGQWSCNISRLWLREKLVEREDMNFCLPAGPETCLSILASCDRYPEGKVYTLIYARIEVGKGDYQTWLAKLLTRWTWLLD